MRWRQFSLTRLDHPRQFTRRRLSRKTPACLMFDATFRGIRTQSRPGSFSIDGIGCTAGSVPHANSSLKASRKVARWNVVTCARRIGIRIRAFRKYRRRSCACCYARLKVNFDFEETGETAETATFPLFLFN